MKILRTPDTSFQNLKDYPFKPHYTEIIIDANQPLRVHHIDEGPDDAPILLCLHGQPVWSYLYRKMIPILNDNGIRVIAPDLPGYGKSDKPSRREDYSYQNQVDWMTSWLEVNDFSNLTFFGQDWGGLIGLRMVANQPHKFNGIVISNTGLPYNPNTPEEIINEVNKIRDEEPTPTLIEMAKHLNKTDKKGASAFAYWQKYCWETQDIPIGIMMSTMIERRKGKVITALDMLMFNLGLKNISPFRSELNKAYEAPFPNKQYKMCPRAMPSQVPTLSSDPSMDAQAKAWDFYRKFEKPFLCAFSSDDPVTRGADKKFKNEVPGAKNQKHCIINKGGHFIQENKPDEISKVISDFIFSEVVKI